MSLNQSFSISRLDKALKTLGLPARDAHDLPTSGQTFADGGHYRIEISGVERFSALQAMVEAADALNVPVHRIIATVGGATLLSRQELRDFAQLAAERRIEVILTPGPRRTWDLGPQIRTTEGLSSGLRTRGADAVNYLLRDIQRGIDAGFRGFLILDEGVLWTVSQLRDQGIFPSDVIFKVSVYAGHGNPAGAKVLESLGADSFNPLADLTPAMLAAIRQTVKIPLDVYTYIVEEMGGFNRMAEAAEIVRVCSPCYLKFEPGESEAVIYRPYAEEAYHQHLIREKVRFAAITCELIASENPDLRSSPAGSSDLVVPQP
jgi:hypothetical protein